MVGMLMRYDNRARMSQRVLLGLVLSVIEITGKTRREEVASGRRVDDNHRAVGIEDLVCGENQLMAVEADTTEEDCGRRPGVCHFSGVDFDGAWSGLLIGELS